MRGGPIARRRLARTALALDERAVFAHEQVEGLALFVGELQEDLLAFRVLETFAVLLEEAVRVALAADADEQRLLIVDAAQQAVGAFGEQPVGGALEEEERRARLELGIAREQLLVPPLELAEMLLLFRRQIVEHLAAARITRHARRARVELEPAAFGGDGDAQRVAREQQVGMPGVADVAVAPRAALVARAVDLHDALRRTEAARAGDFLDQPLDVGAEH